MMQLSSLPFSAPCMLGRSKVQHNTFFLTIFDAFVDTTFGAVLPACMVAEAAVDFWVDVDIVYIGEKKLAPPQLQEAIGVGGLGFRV